MAMDLPDTDTDQENLDVPDIGDDVQENPDDAEDFSIGDTNEFNYTDTESEDAARDIWGGDGDRPDEDSVEGTQEDLDTVNEQTGDADSGIGVEGVESPDDPWSDDKVVATNDTPEAPDQDYKQFSMEQCVSAVSKADGYSLREAGYAFQRLKTNLRDDINTAFSDSVNKLDNEKFGGKTADAFRDHAQKVLTTSQEAVDQITEDGFIYGLIDSGDMLVRASEAILGLAQSYVEFNSLHDSFTKLIGKVKGAEAAANAALEGANNMLDLAREIITDLGEQYVTTGNAMGSVGNATPPPATSGGGEEGGDDKGDDKGDEEGGDEEGSDDKGGDEEGDTGEKKEWSEDEINQLVDDRVADKLDEINTESSGEGTGGSGEGTGGSGEGTGGSGEGTGGSGEGTGGSGEGTGGSGEGTGGSGEGTGGSGEGTGGGSGGQESVDSGAVDDAINEAGSVGQEAIDGMGGGESGGTGGGESGGTGGGESGGTGGGESGGTGGGIGGGIGTGGGTGGGSGSGTGKKGSGGGSGGSEQQGIDTGAVNDAIGDAGQAGQEALNGMGGGSGGGDVPTSGGDDSSGGSGSGSGGSGGGEDIPTSGGDSGSGGGDSGSGSGSGGSGGGEEKPGLDSGAVDDALNKAGNAATEAGESALDGLGGSGSGSGSGGSGGGEEKPGLDSGAVDDALNKAGNAATEAGESALDGLGGDDSSGGSGGSDGGSGSEEEKPGLDSGAVDDAVDDAGQAGEDALDGLKGEDGEETPTNPDGSPIEVSGDKAKSIIDDMTLKAREAGEQALQDSVGPDEAGSEESKQLINEIVDDAKKAGEDSLGQFTADGSPLTYDEMSDVVDKVTDTTQSAGDQALAEINGEQDPSSALTKDLSSFLTPPEPDPLGNIGPEELTPDLGAGGGAGGGIGGGGGGGEIPVPDVGGAVDPNLVNDGSVTQTNATMDPNTPGGQPNVGAAPQGNSGGMQGGGGAGGGSPMMPPMGGMGGGMGGGAGQQGQNRESNTWLMDDGDTWREDGDNTVQRVIGRDE